MPPNSTLPAAQSVRFLLDGEVVHTYGVPATRTLLQYLREDLGRTGTKEGCAEGDCGACTVVLAERIVEGAGERLRWRAVNACIQFVPAIDGKALFTVESLKDRGRLHPVQQAMVDCHGSQCGFCTPGFVMSLYALYKTNEAPDRAAIDQALAGNLCRCTGYRPIVAAAERMAVLPPAAEPDEKALLASLRALERPAGVAFPHSEGTFYAPRTVTELAALREAMPQARIVAGSTDVGLWVTKQHRDLGDLIFTGTVAELARLRATPSHLDIGAAVTVTDAMEALAAEYEDLRELFVRYASPPIRNAATLGGNVANGSPIGDSMPALIALDATVVLRKGPRGRELALESFYLDYQKTALAPGEFVERLLVPRGQPGVAFRAYKISKRFDQDISALLGAFRAEFDGGNVKSLRIAFGGMAAIPKRAPATEAALIGKPWTEANVRAAMGALATDFKPISDMRASHTYRARVAANLLYKFYLETGAGVSRTRLYGRALA